MGSVHSINTTAELERFFAYLYGEQSGFAYSPLKVPEEKDLKQYFFKWPEEKNILIDHVIENSSVYEVYTSPALFAEPDAKKASFKGTHFVWAEFDGEIPKELTNVPSPNLRIQSSVSGHEHWYWKVDGFITDIDVAENISQRIAYALRADLSCWNANRVLRPPTSTHHESGRNVTVLHWDSARTSVARFVNLPPIPFKMLSGTDINAVPDALDVIFKYPFKSEDVEFFRAKKIAPGPNGGRSAALAKLGHICMEMGMTNAEALSLLMNADERWGKYKHRRDRKERLLGIINYCRSKHPVDLPESDQVSAFKVYNLEEFLNTKVRLEWVVEGLVHRKGFASISGPAGTGKTIFSLRMAEKLAQGKNFLKWKTPNPVKTLFVSMEMNHEELRYFMDSMQLTANDLLRENMLILPLGQSVGLTNTKSRARLTAAVEEYKPDGIILDSWGVAIGENLNSETVTFSALNYIHEVLRNQYGAFVWAITHPRKGQPMNKKPDTLDDVFGSVYFGAAISSAISLWRVANEFEVKCLKMRMSPMFAPFNIRRTPLLDYETVGSSVLDSLDTAPDEKVVPVLGDWNNF